MAQVISLTTKQREYLKELLITVIYDINGVVESAPTMKVELQTILDKLNKQTIKSFDTIADNAQENN